MLNRNQWRHAVSRSLRRAKAAIQRRRVRNESVASFNLEPMEGRVLMSASWAGAALNFGDVAPIDLSLEDSREAGDRFGHALAKGDFNGDGYDDLAVGAYGEDVGAVANAGAVQVIYGTYYGLSDSWDKLLTQNDVTGTSVETNDRFGYTLASGDFNGDGFDDLVIGSPFEDWGSATDAGVVHVMYGSSSGISSLGNQIFLQATSKNT